MSEQDQGQPAGPEKDPEEAEAAEAPAVTVQAGLAAASGSVAGEYAEAPDLNWHPDGTEGSDES